MAGDLRVTKKRLRVEMVLGENTNQVTLTSDIRFPVEVKKIKDVHTDIRNLSAKPIKDKVIVEGILHKQIAWVAECDGVYDGLKYEAGGVYDLPVDEKFTHFVDLPGATPESTVTVDARVEYVDHAEKTTGDKDSPDIWKQTVIIELFVRVTQAIDADVVTDVSSASMDLNVVKDRCTVESVVGEASRQVNIAADIQFPRNVAKIKDVQTRLRDVDTEVLQDKVIVKGVLHKQIYYIEEGSQRMFETSVDEEWSEYVDLPGVEPGMDVTASAVVEFAEVELKTGQKNKARQTAIIKLNVKAMRDVTLDFVSDVTGENIRVIRGSLKCENVIGAGTSQVALREDVIFEQPVKKIMTVDSKVNFNRKDTKVLPDKVVVEGILHKQVFYVGLCDEAVWEKSLDEPFTTFIDIPGATPHMNVSVKGRVEHVDLAGPSYPGDCCHHFKPEDYPWKQTAVVEVEAKVTQTHEVDVVVDVLVEDQDDDNGVEPPEPEDCVPDGPGAPSIRFYIIQPGDTFWKLAQRYGTTVEAIVALNPGLDPQNLQIGQMVRIPCTIPGAKG